MENSIKKSFKTSNGITLIALVITIIVLLILAGISISMLSGDNGLLKRAGQAREKTIESQVKEDIEIAAIRGIADYYNGCGATALKKDLCKKAIEEEVAGWIKFDKEHESENEIITVVKRNGKEYTYSIDIGTGIAKEVNKPGETPSDPTPSDPTPSEPETISFTIQYDGIDYVFQTTPSKMWYQWCSDMYEQADDLAYPINKLVQSAVGFGCDNDIVWVDNDNYDNPYFVLYDDSGMSAGDKTTLKDNMAIENNQTYYIVNSWFYNNS